MKYVHFLTFRIEDSNGVSKVKQVSLESQKRILTAQQFNDARLAAISYCHMDVNDVTASIIDHLYVYNTAVTGDIEY